MSQSRHEIRAAQLRNGKRGSRGGRSSDPVGLGGDDGQGSSYTHRAGLGGDDGQGSSYTHRAGGLGGDDGYGSSYTHRAGELGGGYGGRGGGGQGGGRGGGGGRGRRGEPERPGWKRFALGTLKWGSIAGAVLFVMGVIGAFVAYSKTPIPDANDMVDLQVSIVYYADGKTELDRIAVADGNRESVKLASVPKVVQDAHIAAEDRTFYQNNGISVGGILRAVKTSVTGEAQVGGSTITQQYVKNYFLTQDRTLTRKAKEIMIAMKIDGEQSKEEILENYLNTIYYGRGAYGIQSGAKAYFGKDVSKLTVAESAVLASVINAPSYYDPSNGEKAKANLEERFDYVLDGMVEEGWLSAADRAKITGLPKILPYTPNKFGGGTKGYITAAVREELKRNGLSEAELERGGLRIVTTIDKKAQANAVASMKKNLPKGVGGGLVAIRPGDGAVVAMYGGADYSKAQFNVSLEGSLQAGSNFKPFAVIAALREGMSTKTTFDGNSPKTFKEYPHPVNNYDDTDYGRVDMRKMIGRSINTAFVELNQKVTPVKTKEAAIDAGIPENTVGLKNDLGNVLGTSSPRVIDMASAYSTIASQGVRSTPYFVKSVTSTRGGGYSYEAKPKTQRAFPKEITADVTDAMTATVKKGGTATKIGREMEGRPVAGKTGTSEENKSKWFSGFVPQLATAVVIYKPGEGNSVATLSKAESQDEYGATVPANIWLDFMKPTLDGVEVMPFPKRAGIGDDKVPTTTTTTTPPPTTTTTTPPKSTAPGQTKEPGKPTKTEEPTQTETTLVPLPTTPEETTTTTDVKPGNGGG